ncbi:MAG: CHAT domain-containing tetratricopeptide repeat protein, partial [Cyanobacteria bacterium J06598_3]
GNAYAELGNLETARDRYEQAAALYRELNDIEGTGTVLNNLASLYSDLGDRTLALESYNQALEIAIQLEDTLSQATTRNNLGVAYTAWDEPNRAIEQHTEALKLYKSVADKDGEANALSNLGSAYSALDKKETALDYYQQAAEIYQTTGKRSRRATVLNNIGQIYQDAGAIETALEKFEQALTLFQEISNVPEQAVTLNNIGNAYSALNDTTTALSFYQQALELHQSGFSPSGKATVLGNIGNAYNNRNNYANALNYYQQSLAIFKEIESRSGQAEALLNLGYVLQQQDETTSALENYQSALALFQEIGDRTGTATTYNNIAVLQEAQGNPTAALENINQAIALIEDLRSDISPGKLRTSYFATVQDVYRLKQDLLMQLGQPEAAFNTSEAARARQLIELLTEANVDIRANVDPTLLTQEQSLRRDLQNIESQRIALQTRNRTSNQIAEQTAALDQQSDTLLQKLDQAFNTIRRQSPAYAETVIPQPLSLTDIQQQVLDANTVLMQYTLTDTEGYLWIVSADQFEVYTLSSQADIQTAAKKFQSAIANSGTPTSAIKRAGDDLRNHILPTLPDWTTGKRLLIVGDGILSEIPFVALPLPNQSDYTPLLSEHEVLSQPSMTALWVLRQQQQRQNRPHQSTALAVLADPVYRADDERVTGQAASQQIPNPPPSSPLPSITERNLRALDLRSIERLPYTRQEANNILALAASNNLKSISALDFAASADWLATPDLSTASIVHLATHGFINPTNPQLSGIALSLVNERGQTQDNGLLRLHDIFNLQLSADLVVLSACQTGQGQNISGEGIIGLSRGFMYAGAQRIAVSLWNVNDQATATLMSEFYRYLLEDNLTPAAALRAAQLDAWQTGQNPYRWAAFTLQGEWQ